MTRGFDYINRLPRLPASGRHVAARRSPVVLATQPLAANAPPTQPGTHVPGFSCAVPTGTNQHHRRAENLSHQVQRPSLQVAGHPSNPNRLLSQRRTRHFVDLPWQTKLRSVESSPRAKSFPRATRSIVLGQMKANSECTKSPESVAASIRLRNSVS